MKFNVIIILILASTAVFAQTLCTPASYTVGYSDPSGDYNTTAGPAGDIISVNYSTQGCVMMVVAGTPGVANASEQNLLWDIIYDNGTGGTSTSTYFPTDINGTSCAYDLIIDRHWTGGFPTDHYHTANLSNPPTYFNLAILTNTSGAACGSYYCIEWAPAPLSLPAPTTPFVAATFNLGTASFDTLQYNLSCLTGQVPEFGTTALIIAILGGLTGVFLLRKIR